MGRGIVSSEGINARSFPCINGSVAAITRGRPVMRKPIKNWKGEVVYGKHAAALGEFAGVLSQDLEYNGVADVSSSKLKREGRVSQATVLVHATPALYVVGAHLLPAWDSTNGSHFTQVAYHTGIVLLSDFTAKTAATLYKAENGAGAAIWIEDAAGHHKMPLHYLWNGVLVADVDYFEATPVATNATTTTVVTTFLNSGTPDYPRNVTVTPGGTTADVAVGTIDVVGTDVNGDALTESISIAANASTIVSGAKAFATITSVTFGIQDGTAATFTIGTGVLLGLGRCFPAIPPMLQSRADGTIESTAATIATDVDDVSGNTISFDTAPGSNVLETWLLAV